MSGMMWRAARALVFGMALTAPARVEAQNVTLTKPVLRIGAAEGDSTQVLFGVWSAARRSDGSVVLANTGTNQVRIYDRTGKQLATIGRKGAGPGEFQFLQRIGAIRGDSIVAYDVGLGRITWFTPAGKLVRTVQLQPLGNGVLPLSVGFTDTGRMLAHSDFARVFGRGEKRDTLTYVLYDLKGAPSDTLGVYPGVEEFHLASPEAALRRAISFGRNSFAAVRGGRIAIGSNDSYRFDIFNSSPTKVVTHQENRPAVKVRAEDVAVLDKEWLAGMPAFMKTSVTARMKEFPVRATYPAYEGLLASADGAVWAGDVKVPGATSRVWTVRKPDGATVWQVRVPAGVDLLDVGADYALGREKDADGVEYVVMYSLPVTTRR